MDSESFPKGNNLTELKSCKNELVLIKAKYDIHMRFYMNRLVTKSKAGPISDEDSADLERIQEIWAITNEALNVCTKAEGHMLENVSSIQNIAKGEAIQYLASTQGVPFNGKNVSSGKKAKQFGGYPKDESLKEIIKETLGGSLNTKYDNDPEWEINRTPAISAPTEQPSMFQGIDSFRGAKLSKVRLLAYPSEPSTASNTASPDPSAEMEPETFAMKNKN
jgi:hypothetical protein